LEYGHIVIIIITAGTHVAEQRRVTVEGEDICSEQSTLDAVLVVLSHRLAEPTRRYNTNNGSSVGRVC